MAEICDNDIRLEVWRCYRSFGGKYGVEYVVKKLNMPLQEIERLVNSFEQEIVAMARQGKTIKEICRTLKIAKGTAAKTLQRLDVRPIPPRFDFTERETKQPPEAVYYPDDNGWLGFVMTPEEYERLVNIRIIKRCSGGVKLEKQYQSINNPFIPMSPFERRLVTKEEPLPIVKSEYYDY